MLDVFFGGVCQLVLLAAFGLSLTAAVLQFEGQPNESYGCCQQRSDD